MRLPVDKTGEVYQASFLKQERYQDANQDNNGIRLVDMLKRIRRCEKDADRGPNRPRFVGADQEAIPWHAEFGTLKSENIRCYTQFKRIDGVVNENRNGTHGSFLMLLVFSATGRSVPSMAKS